MHNTKMHMYVNFELSITNILRVIDINLAKKTKIAAKQQVLYKIIKLFVCICAFHRCTCKKFQLYITNIVGDIDIEVCQK